MATLNLTEALTTEDKTTVEELAMGVCMSSVISISEMLALSAVDDMSVNVSGYATANDGGGGIFTYDSSLSATNNGGTIINGWVRQYSGAINVKWFGAKGDGATDDTASIVATHDYIVSVGGSDGYINDGNFLITLPIKIDDIVWRGTGAFVTNTESPMGLINEVRTPITDKYKASSEVSMETIVPSDHFRVLSTTLTPKVVIMGDSLSTPFADAINKGDGDSATENMWSTIKKNFTLSNPHLDFTFVNRAVGATTWTNADKNIYGEAPSNIDWYTIDQDWLIYAETEQPDLLILSWGMNDRENIAASRIRSVVNKISVWAKVPDILFITPMVPSRMTDTSTISGQDAQNGRDFGAGLIRTFCEYNDYPYIDLNKRYNIVRDGKDVTNSYYEKTWAAPSQTLPVIATNKESADFGVDLEFTNIPIGFFGDLDTSGTDRLRIYTSPYLYPNSKSYIEIGDSGGFVSVSFYYVDGSAEYLKHVSTYSTPITTSDVTMKVYLKGSYINIFVDDVLIYQGKLIRLGGVFEPKIEFSLGTVASDIGITLYSGNYIDAYTPITTDKEIWGDDGRLLGGNDINHPTSFGTAIVIVNEFMKHSWIIPVIIEDKKNNKVGIRQSEPFAFVHVGSGSGKSPSASANQLALETGSEDCGISLLSKNTQVQRIIFGDEDNNSIGNLAYNHNSDTLSFKIGGDTAYTQTTTRAIFSTEVRMLAEDGVAGVSSSNRSTQFTLVNDTTLRIYVRGNDGTVRSVDLTLTT